MNEIKFYTPKCEYGYMSNFYKCNQIIDGELYITNEHYYQSQKAITNDMKKWIRQAPTPYSAMMAGRNLKKSELRPDWETFKISVMLNGLKHKFNQNKDLNDKLISTGDSVIHEDSPTDMVWGILGEDMLGKLLMKVREEIILGGNIK